jgi:hypothetical protein
MVLHAPHLLSVPVFLFQIVSTHVLFLQYIFIVRYFGELLLVSYVSSVVDRYNSCCLDCDVCCCDDVAAVGHVVTCIHCLQTQYINIIGTS